MCKAHEVASQFFRNADIFDPFLSCQAFSVFHAVFVATDTTQENGLSVQQNVSAVHANFTKADPVADGIGSTGYFYIIQLRFFRCPKLRFCIKNNFSGGNVGVAGLVTATDIIAQCEGRLSSGTLGVPAVMLREEKDTFLDDMTIEQLGQRLGVKVEVLPTGGGDEAKALLRSGLHIARRRRP